jgi:hypothetical protein
MGRARSTGTKVNAYRVWVRKPGRPRRRWVNNIKMNLREIGCGGMDWIHMTLHSAHAVYLCVSCGSHNKHRIFP